MSQDETGAGDTDERLGVRPSVASMAVSRSVEGFGVVSNLSPANMELAPARKQRACSDSGISRRPAESRTMAVGMMIRAVAIIRSMDQTLTLGEPSSGVPSIATSALTGTL